MLILTGLRKYSMRSFIKHNSLIFLTLDKDGFLFGATWFMGSLFLVSVVYKILDNKTRDVKENKILLFVLAIGAYMLGINIPLPLMISRTLILSLFFAIGVLIRRYEEYLRKINKNTLFVFCFVMFAIIDHYNSVGLGANEFKYKEWFFIGSLTASFVVYYLAICIEKVKTLSAFFVLLGKYSVDIVIWQFVMFRPIILIQLMIKQLPLSDVVGYYPMFYWDHGWWIIYLLAGVFGSLLWGWLLKQGIWGRALRKINVVS